MINNMIIVNNIMIINNIIIINNITQLLKIVAMMIDERNAFRLTLPSPSIRLEEIGEKNRNLRL